MKFKEKDTKFDPSRARVELGARALFCGIEYDADGISTYLENNPHRTKDIIVGPQELYILPTNREYAMELEDVAENNKEKPVIAYWDKDYQGRMWLFLAWD